MISETTSPLPNIKTSMRPRTLSLLVLSFFFVSGACGLMYQVVWLRVMGLVFGNTTYATSAVLSGYMAGLGLGALCFGKWIDKPSAGDPVKLYGIMEGGVGAYALLTPFIWYFIDWINIVFYRAFNPEFLQFSLFKFAVSFVFLFIPTFLMGGTLPVLSKFYIEHRDQIAHKVGILYALNTAGAVLGVIFSGFFCLYYFGVWQTTVLTAVLNLLIFAACWFWIKGNAAGASALPPEIAVQELPAPSKSQPNAYYTTLLVLFGISGGVSMMYEIGWTRILAIVVGSSIYAFSVMLSTFLLGIALGSFLFSWLSKRIKIDLSIFATLQAATALFAFLGMNQFEEMPYRFLKLYHWSKHTPFLIELGRFALCTIVMLGPTICIGAMFACFIHLYHQQERLGGDIGTAYFANTVGTIFGSALTGFLIIPILGIYKTLMAAAGLNAAIGAIAFMMSLPNRQLRRTIAFSVVFVFTWVGASLARPWNKSVITSGAVVRPNMHNANSQEEFIRSMENRLNLFYKEGTSATVSVNRVRDVISLAVNGKTDASNGTDAFNQFLLGHLPMLLNPDAQKVLTIGLGSGSTVAAVASYAVKQIDCVELEAAVVEGARFFSELNRNVLNDPRLRMIVNDGRNYLKINPTLYDVIISEPSNPWMAGVANLFSREHYETMKARLAPQGIVCQWLHAYSMSDQDMRMIIRTFTLVFPNTSLWTSNYPDLLLLGSNEPIEIDYLELKKSFNRPEVLQDFEPYGIKTADGFLGAFWLDDEALRSFSEGARINSDNYPYLEFSAPRHLYDDTVSSNYHLINAFASKQYPKIKNLNPPIDQNIEFHVNIARSNFYRKIYGRVQSELDFIKELDPKNPDLIEILGMVQYEMGNFTDAERLLSESLIQNPDSPETHFYFGLIQQRKKRHENAIFSFGEAIQLDSRAAKYYIALGDSLMEMNAFVSAVDAFDQALIYSPAKFDLLIRKASALSRIVPINEQIRFTEELLEMYPKHVALYEMLGNLYQNNHQRDDAEKIYLRMIQEFPLEPNSYLQLGILYGKTGSMMKAKEQLKKAVRYDPELLKNPEIQKVLQYKGA